MKLDPEVLEENRKMAVGCLCCSLLMAAGFLVARRFDLSVLLGILVGFLLAAGNFFFMSVGITRALATGDEAAAKAKMRTSYIVRTIVMLAVMALSLAVEQIHWLPVLASVFYPRIVLTARSLWSWYKAKKNPLPPEVDGPEAGAPDDASDGPDALPARSLPSTEDEEEEDAPDEFEKFVSHFSKGPVPGAEQGKDPENQTDRTDPEDPKDRNDQNSRSGGAGAPDGESGASGDSRKVD